MVLLSEIHIRVSGHHDNKDVMKLAQTFLKVLKTLQVIPESSQTPTKVPSLVFARLTSPNATGSDASEWNLQQVMTYKDLTRHEERQKRRRKLMSEKNLAPMTSVSQIKRGSIHARNQSPATAHEADNVEPFDYDVSTWSKVFFSHLHSDLHVDENWKENVMWASPMTSAGASRHRDAADSRDNMRFFEDLYFESKFDEQLNLSTSL